jgi:uncharacterized protein
MVCMLIPVLYRPNTLAELSIDTLVANGIAGLLLDLDNTLMLPKTGVLDPEIADWLSHARARGIQIAVVSNNRRAHYVQDAGTHLDCPAFAQAHKPNPATFQHALSVLGLSAQHVLVVGDQVIADGLGAKRLGAGFVWVHPLIGNREWWVYRLLRRLESVLAQRPAQPVPAKAPSESGSRLP